MERLEPKMSVDASGNITWLPTIVDYDPSLFFRGKKVTNEEFNELFLQQAYQGNYTADSLSAFLEKHLRPTIHRTFTSTFNLLPSYVKTFTSSDWGELQEDGYYYITITPEEHGFKPDESLSELERMNIDTEVYLMDADGQFFEVTQVETTKDNIVTIYTDDNTVSGFVVIRTNDKAYALAAASIDASQVEGLHPVATSGRYTDLVDIDGPTGPNTRIAQNAVDILDIVNGNTVVAKARQAESAEHTNALLLGSTIQGISVSNIFEEGSNYVKDATHALQADNADLASVATVAQYADEDTSKGTIADRLDKLGFKSGSVVITNSHFTAQTNNLKRQGNYVLCNLTIDDDGSLFSGANVTVGEIPLEFRPTTKQQYSAYANLVVEGSGIERGVLCKFFIWEDGRITFNVPVQFDFSQGSPVEKKYYIYTPITVTNFGYEANPIT